MVDQLIITSSLTRPNPSSGSFASATLTERWAATLVLLGRTPAPLR